jgi:DNA-binding CsgD family transcriptional regulator
MPGYSSLSAEVQTAAERVLTRKQLDVFKLHCAGCSYRRIATMLEIGVPTVRGHLDAAHHRLEREGVVRADFRSYRVEVAA